MAQFVVSFMRQRRTCSGCLGIFWSGIALLCSLSVCLAATEDEDACKICTCNGTNVDCSGRNLSSLPSGIPHGTTELNLTHNFLKNIKKDNFKNLTELRYLRLDDNQISYIQGGSLLPLNNLQVLNLSYNTLSTIPSKLFYEEGTEKKISEIYFSNNNITEVSADAFLGVSCNDALDLSYNRFTSFPEDLLRFQHELQYLHLGNNNITCLTKGMFDGLKSLIGLNVNHNNITEVSPDAFLGANSIEYLDLSDNILSTIPSNLFYEGGTEKKLIEFSNNNITQVSADAFLGVSSVDTLSLGMNNIQSLPNDLFANMTIQRLLDLSYNRFTSFPEDLLRFQHELKFLQLGYNNITFLIKEMFHGLKSLIAVILSNNKLSAIPSKLFFEEGKKRSIQEINFNHNSITEVSPDAFLGVSSIDYLLLGINQIWSLPEDLFDNVTILHILDLSFNRFTSFPEKPLRFQHELQQLYLQHNDISCLSQGMFDGLHSLKLLMLAFNPINKIDDKVFSNTQLVDLLLFNNNLSSLGDHPFTTQSKSLHTVFLNLNDFDVISDSVWQDLGPNCTVILENTLKKVPYTRSDLNIELVGKGYVISILMTAGGLASQAMNQSGFNCTAPDLLSEEVTCSECPQGTYGGSFGGCKACPRGGFYQNQTGAVVKRDAEMNCEQCNNGTYVPLENVPGKTIGDCAVCPTGTNKSLHAGYRACPCASNHYRKHRFDQCFPCPKKGINCTGEYQHLLPGFWWTWDWGPAENYQSYKKFVKNLLTCNDSYDRHTERFDGMLPNVHKCPTSESCKNLAAGINATCDDGHAGFLCTQCQAGSYAWLDKCFECPGIWALILEVLAALVILAVLFIIVLLELRRHKRSGRSLISVLFSRFKILLGFYQIMGEIFEVMNELSWPETLVELGSFLQLLEANLMQVIVSPRCYFPDFTYPNVYIAFIAGASFSVTVILSGLGIYGFRQFHLRVKSAPDEVRKHTLAKTNERILLAVVILLFVAYPSLSAVIISLLPSGCVTFSLNENENVTVTRLRSDYSVDCNSSQHVAFNYAAEVSVSYVVGFPTVLLIMLWLHRRRQASKKKGHQLETADIQAPSHVDQQSLLDTDEIAHIGDSLERLSSELPLEELLEVSSESITWVSFLDENYKEQYWYWEIVELARKVLQVLFVLLFGADDQFILFATIIVSVAFLIAHAYLKPMKDAAEHRIQMWSLTTIFLNLLAASLLVLPSEDGHTDDSDARKEFLAVFLVLLNISIFVIVAVSSIHVCLKVLSQTACCSYTAACFRHICRCLAPSHHRTQEEHRDDTEPTTTLISGVPIEDRRNNNECRAV